MSSHLGVTFAEKDLSKSISALSVPAGALAGYSVMGPTDKAYLCRSEDDLRRLFGQPSALMTDGGLSDYNRGLHNAFRFVRAGLPVFFKRPIPSSVAPVKAAVLFQTDGGAGAANSIQATAKGHGDHYNGLSVFVKGIESVQRQVTLVGATPFDLEDCVLPGTLVVTSSGSSADTDDDKDKAVYGMAPGDTKALSTTATGTLTIEYENATSHTTNLTAATGATVLLTYERTTSQRVVRVYISDDGTVDPAASNYENYLVSFKKNGKTEAGVACFIADVINGVSEIIDIAVGSTYEEAKLPLSFESTTYTGGLAGGTNGTYAAADADIKTAYDAFDNRTLYDIVYLFDAGYDDTVKKEIADICSRRKFPHAYLDPKMGTFLDSSDNNTLKSDLVESRVVDELCDWRMGLGSREFASLAGSAWGLITDEFNGGRKLWMPPTYEVGSLAIVVDNTLGSWKSVMGPRRGVTSFEKLAINLYEYRDELNAKQVNPLIVDERGIQMYYGNKTLKIVASAMQQSHARKTRGRISRRFYFIALDYIAEDIVGSTFNDIRDEFEAVLVNEYGPALESYSLVVGPPATTQADINNQILRIKVGLIFNQIAEEIIIETSVYRIGVDLSVQVL